MSLNLSKNHKINLLPEHIIDQIKAGEVIERPATLLKELLENSIDAQAKKIRIHIINYGLDLISIEDNGIGIDTDDLALAFCRHATSKIDNFEDLYSLYTYGFRGEALASVASVSKVTCTSNKENQPSCTIKINGGETISHTKEDRLKKDSGTSIYIKDLFYNTPVRVKFLQSQTSEKNQLKKIINAFILTHPEIEFSIKWDEAEKETYSATVDLNKRIKKLFEKKKNPLELIHFQSEYDGSKAEIFISLNSSKGHAGKFQYIFINERLVQDIQIHKVILNSAQSMWPFGESGNYIIFLNVSPGQLDVNVHPNKTVIKLFSASSVFSLIASSIKKHLPKSSISTSDLIHTQSSFEIAKDHKSFSEINYRSQDFSDKSSLENYFYNLDSQQSNNTSSFQVLFKDDDAIFFKDQEDFFILKNKECFFHYLQTIFKEDKQKLTTPLLVSTPIETNQKVTSEKIRELNEIGFEIDFFADTTLILRSFPSILTSLDNEKVLTLLLKKEVNIQGAQISIPENLKFHYIPTSGNLKSMLELIGKSKLIEKKILKKIKGKDFLNLI